MPPEIAQDLIERRVRGGFGRDDSEAVLRELVDLYGDSPNFGDMLIGEGFARQASASRAVAAIAHERSPGRIPSDKPQTVSIGVIRKGDTFADGEFSQYEKVQGVHDLGHIVAINTDASLEHGAEPYEFKKTDTVWAITR